jgi:hypothetical protein
MDCMVCNTSCQLVPGNVTGFCGDGVIQPENAEECDEPTAPCPYGQMRCMSCDAQCKRRDQVLGLECLWADRYRRDLDPLSAS